MKKITYIFSLFVLSLALSSCFKDNKVTFQGAVVEFDETVVRPPIVGTLTYPAINVTRTAGALTTRVNLVAAQRSSDQTIRVVFDAQATAEAVTALRTLNPTANISAAVEGTNFRLGNNGNVVIPANNSFGSAGIEILNVTPATAPATSVVFVIRLEGNDEIKPSENYKRLAYRVSLN
jgi:hypothetical protein